MEPLTRSLIDAALRGALIAWLLLLAAVLLRDRRDATYRRLGIAMSLGLIVQVVEALPGLQHAAPLAWRSPLIAVSLGNAVLFWLFVRSLVDDDFRLRPRHASIWLAVVVFVLVRVALGGQSPAAPALLALQRAVPAVFAALTVVVAALHWRADLVERRRWLRGFIVVTGVLYAAMLLWFRVAAVRGGPADDAVALDLALLLAIVGVVALRLLRLGGGDLLIVVEAASPAGAPVVAEKRALPAPAGVVDEAAPGPPEPPDAAEQRQLDALHHAMAVERVYRTEDLTVAGLAARLGLPEYRLRRLINQRLGQRNFNVYVNGFRLDEARAALADPGRRDLPILTIALTAGFQSIGPFNRAFKAATGRTPGEYRREKLADS